jgi:hypothetical protein
VYSLKVKKTEFSPLGITFLSKPADSLYDFEEYKSGKFEVQDEASQLVAFQVDCHVVPAVLMMKRPGSKLSLGNWCWTTVQAPEASP